MVSRDTTVHAAAVAVAVILVALLNAAGFSDSTAATVASALVFYGLVLGGAHLFLALRHDDGMIPAESRWRYLGMLAVVLVGGAIAALAGSQTVAGLRIRQVAAGVAVVVALGWLITEALDGYRSAAAGD